MSKTLRADDGTYAGSVGDGATRIPTPASTGSLTHPAVAPDPALIHAQRREAAKETVARLREDAAHKRATRSCTPESASTCHTLVTIASGRWMIDYSCVICGWQTRVSKSNGHPAGWVARTAAPTPDHERAAGTARPEEVFLSPSRTRWEIARRLGYLTRETRMRLLAANGYDAAQVDTAAVQADVLAVMRSEGYTDAELANRPGTGRSQGTSG